MKKEIKNYFSKLGKLSHKKSPRSREYFVELGKKRQAKRKLSTANGLLNKVD